MDPRILTREMLEALRRGETPRFPDGSPATEGWGMLSPELSRLGPTDPIFDGLAAAEDEPPTLVRLMPEYSAPSPLWPLSDATDALVPEPLLARLIAWQQDFDANFRWNTGWESQEAKTRWAQEAETLEAELREALRGKAELTVDLWPLEGD